MTHSISLRDKVLFMMTAITAITLSLYLYVAIRIFRQDKLADVSYSSATVSQAMASQTRIELDSLANTVKMSAMDFVLQTNTLSPGAIPLLRDDGRFKSVSVYREIQPPTYQVVRTAQIASNATFPQLSQNQLSLIDRQGTYIAFQNGSTKDMILGVRLGSSSSPQKLILVSVVTAPAFARALTQSAAYSYALVDENNNLLLSNGLKDAGLFRYWAAKAHIQFSKMLPGTSVVKDPTSHQQLLAAYAPVGFGNLVVFSLVSKHKAMSAVGLLVTKSILMFIALLALTIIIGIVASKQITYALMRLKEASQDMATGNFNVHIDIESKDEVGALATSFNVMAEKLSYYVTQVAEKAAMEAELNTAKTVQDTLFPADNTHIAGLNISGHYEPASQCGGDWWFYCEISGRVFLWIGDATGHGVSAALLTSAARATAAIIEMMPDASPRLAMQLMNRSIHDTSKAKILMTFFIASFDPKTGELVYANASHEPPFLFKSSSAPLTKENLLPLNDVNGPRLGESLDANYEEARVQLAPTDRIFFYTDGAPDIKDPDGKALGERNLIKNLISSLNEEPETEQAVRLLEQQLGKFRQGTKLDDDVTFFLCQVDRAA